MNTPSILVLSVLLSSGAALGVQQLLKTDASGPSVADPDAELAVQQVEERLAGLERKLEQWMSRPVEASTAVRTEIDPKMLEDAISAYFASRGGVEAVADRGKGKASKRMTVKQLLDRVVSGDIEVWKLGEYMRDMSEEERKAVVKHFADIAKAKEFDADAQADYGHVLIQKLLNAPILEQGVLGTLADKQYDKALKIDNEHWGARFSKAMSLSNWPAMLGKQPEAMKHFNILIEQQERKQPQPQFTQSYVVLGNLYSQQGKMEEARKVWQRGLKRFPNDKTLRARLELK